MVGDNFDEISKVAGKEVESGTVIKTRIAASWANKLELDLVEISPKGKPPVCKIIDLKKFLYERKKREKELKAKQVKVVIKEIRFGPNTDDHDFEFKLKHAKSFLEDGAKVKAYVQFKGRSIVFKDRGRTLLKRFVAELAELSVTDYPPKMEDRRMHVTLSPKKSAKSK
ncbi:translation initiation factor IF-3 [Saprospira grandis str. Lewin]|uniref:Translation initiation factor IF-3 n=1 Tax=Saprospira grandis (strain Lewin) TaxID=984262 RepID=H6LA76_SAPGL|nr:translation initiation factor IF-3 [Saprospira grandis str. Lewin]